MGLTDADADTDDDLTRATMELGDPDALFQVSQGRHRAKLAAALGLLLFGAVANYAWWVHGPGKIGHIEVKLLIVPVVVGVGLLVHMYRNRGLSVLVYPTGVLRLRRGEVESFPWADVDEVRLKGDAADRPQVGRGAGGEVVQCWLPVTAPAFQVWNTYLHVKRADGAEAKFTPALADYPDLAERVQKGTFAALWPKALAELAAGRAVEFGDVEAGPDGLRTGKQFLPWADVKEMTVSQKNLAVKRRGGWLPWLAKDVSAIPNVHVLFAVYEVMRAAPSAAPAGADGAADQESTGEPGE